MDSTRDYRICPIGIAPPLPPPLIIHLSNIHRNTVFDKNSVIPIERTARVKGTELQAQRVLEPRILQAIQPVLPKNLTGTLSGPLWALLTEARLVSIHIPSYPRFPAGR